MLRLKSFLTTGAVAALVATPALAASGRGTDGTVNILYWQAPSMMNPYLAGGDKEVEAASLVLEPLAGYDENAKLFPRLVVDIPTVENGGISNDLKSITWKLKPGIKWSDNTPVTAKDVVFTANYCMNPKTGCTSLTIPGRRKGRVDRRPDRKGHLQRDDAGSLWSLRRQVGSYYTGQAVHRLLG